MGWCTEGAENLFFFLQPKRERKKSEARPLGLTSEPESGKPECSKRSGFGYDKVSDELECGDWDDRSGSRLSREMRTASIDARDE